MLLLLTLPTTVDHFEWEPESILERRIFKRNNKAVTRWLIKWKDHSSDDATWEDADDVLLRVPEFQA